MRDGLKVGVILGKAESKSDDLTRVLSETYGLPRASMPHPEWDYYLHYREGILELCVNRPQSGSANPLSIKFDSGASLHRLKFDRKIKQPVARAVGIKRGIRPKVCDLTAGFGNDGFVLAGLGCEIVLVERCPLMWALLEDGLRRGRQSLATGDLLKSNVRLVFSDAKNFLEKSDDSFDTLFLDPMYPKREKHALTKIKMRILRDLVGDDQDCSELLRCSLAYAKKRRVVVKRPITAPVIEGFHPSLAIKGKKHRYDIYLPPYL